MLWVVRDGVGLARALNRTMTTTSSTSTKTAIALVSQNRKVLKLVMSSITGEAESCKPNCHGEGWPSPANAAPALASSIAAAAPTMVKRENTFIS